MSFKYTYDALVYFGEDIGKSIERVAKFGYDGIELVGEPDQYDAASIKRQADDAGIVVSSICSIYMGPERDLSHPDAANRRKAVDYVKSVADMAAGTGADVIIVAPAPVGRMEALSDRNQEYGWAVENIRTAGEYAASVGVDLTLECWNRYETFWLNRLADGVAMWRDTGLTNGGVMGDTFHMNIDEATIDGALRETGDVLNHVHLADSNRAAPGEGHTDFRPILQALRDIDYQHWLSFELLPAGADPFATLRAGGGQEFFDQYTEQAIKRVKAIESELGAAA